jgi:hypothetical protein
VTHTYGEIWTKLSKLDLDAKVVKKPTPGNPVYLSWGDAWGVLMEHYPEAYFRFHRSNRRYDGDEIFEALDGSAEVRCTVYIGELRRDMWLPMMDHKHNAVVDPDSRDVSDAKMRCLVKCLALFGLGHSLYAKAKEDVPDESRTQRAKTQRASRQAPGRATDNRARPGQPLAEKITTNTAVSLLQEAKTLDQLNDRYDTEVAEAKKRGDEALLEQLFAVYDLRAAELERA